MANRLTARETGSQRQDGIIYSAGGDIRIASTGTYSAVSKNGFTFFSFVNYAGHVFCAKFDNENVSHPVYPVMVASRNDYTSDIEHNSPTICIDNDGYIYIFYGSHNTQQYYKKSLNPYDIRAWSAKKSVTGATKSTYPKPFVDSNNNIYILFRMETPWSNYIAKSSDGGDTWSVTKIVDPTNSTDTPYIYGAALGTDDSIHLVTNFRSGTASETDPFGSTYYMKSLDGGVTWRKADGTQYTLPADETTLEELESTGAYPGDLKLDSENRPYLCWTNNTSTDVEFIKWTGEEWTDPVTVTNSNRYMFDACLMDILDDNTIDIYACTVTNPAWQGGNLNRYRSTDAGATWSLAETLSTDGDATKVNVYPTLVLNHSDNLKIIWSFGTPTLTYTAPSDFEFKSA